MISTHTLTWSVTENDVQIIYWFIISTHTLTWSVTFKHGYIEPTKRDFNSHAHVERDGAVVQFGKYSTHFNSHAHVERDYATEKFLFKLFNFNSHAHVERDRSALNALLQLYHFNSHAHVERDKLGLSTEDFQPISTHTLTWSVTLKSN